MSEWRSLLRKALANSSIVANFFCLLHITNTYLWSPLLVYGESMLPTLNLSGDVLVVEHFSHRLERVRPGDVVLVRSPSDPTRMITKRIVAMAGDTITFLPHPAATERSRTIQVPKGHIWIQGDNMYASTDSRHYGPVPYGLIQGKVFLRVWPPHGFGSVGQ
ncbi:mitochondrial ATP-independent inner membrane protease subunit 1a [Euphorbia lathyris]|uniref:mitochondrial ATP-independent inner membrane protease subunit 1a n=1 Tax=Euphorbia lathyris TaxID=212925 RepID=UPI0033133EF5